MRKANPSFAKLLEYSLFLKAVASMTNVSANEAVMLLGYRTKKVGLVRALSVSM